MWLILNQGPADLLCSVSQPELHFASATGDIDWLRKLLQAKNLKLEERLTSVDPRALRLVTVEWISTPKLRRVTPLMMAAASGNAKAVTALLQAGAKADSEDSTGRSALNWACERGHKAAAAPLTKAWSNPNPKPKPKFHSLTLTLIG